MGIIRQAIGDWFGTGTQNLFTVDSTMDEAVDYFNRIDDRTRVRERIIDLYGRGITKESDPALRDAALETYVRQGFKTRINAGMQEALCIGFGNKLVNALATLFTEPGQKYTLVSEQDDNPELAEELLSYNRARGGFDTAMVRANKMAVRVGSAAVLMAYANYGVTYQAIGPNAIRVKHAKTVFENGRERAADEKDIEDATCVIIRLSQVTINEWNYLAIFGRSSEYPKGRYVQYVSGNSLSVPDSYAKGTLEYEIGGQQANPLSFWADANPELDIPEYPIAVIYGGVTESDTVFPTSLSLYNQCLDISTAASHTLSKSQEAASGTQTVELEQEAIGKPLPRTLTGPVSLLPGQKYNYHQHDSQACKDAYDVLKELMVDIAASYGVPDYMIVSDDHTLEAASGIALQVKAEPLKKVRATNAKENAESVRKIFETEKALIGLFDDGDAAPREQLLTCSQTWEPGELRTPENKKEKAERIAVAKKEGFTDEIGALREYHDLPSDEEAIALYEKMRDRQADYPPLKKPERPQIGGLQRRQLPATE